MSDENKPKAPVEGRTQAFRLKMDGWMSELITQDFDLEAPAEPPLEIDPATLVPPKDPNQGTPPRSG